MFHVFKVISVLLNINIMKCRNKIFVLFVLQISAPYMWEPEIVDTQILRIGQLALIAVPAEFT